MKEHRVVHYNRIKPNKTRLSTDDKRVRSSIGIRNHNAENLPSSRDKADELKSFTVKVNFRKVKLNIMFVKLFMSFID